MTKFSLKGFKYNMKSPPGDHSPKTISEIKELTKIPDNDKFVKSKDKVRDSFKELFKKESIEYPKKLIDNIIDEADPIIMKFKNKFKRPRPKKIADKKGIKINYLELKTMKTPSYPSGHSTSSKLIAEVLGKKYPKLKAKLNKVAEDISYSRNVAKAHYKSDSEEGIKLGKAMSDYASSFAKRKDPVVGTGKKPKGSDRRLYTDENPKDTVSIKFATVADARATIAKVMKINKPYARKIQILTVLEQRAEVMGKMQQARLAKAAKKKLKAQKEKSPMTKQKGGGTRKTCLPAAKIASMSKSERNKLVNAKQKSGKAGKYKRSSKTNVKGARKKGATLRDWFQKEDWRQVNDPSKKCGEK
tara:strand:- start:395 stop:1471 length:1077 start_codon:yes stop_codon:yes gene_type:complete